MKQNIVKMKILIPMVKNLMVLALIFLLACGGNKEDDQMKDMDKKYLTESELFALNKAIEKDSDEPENYYKRSKVYSERQDDKKALNDILKAISLKNSDPRYFFQKAKIFQKLNKIDSSLNAAEMAETLRYKGAEINVLLSRLYLEKGNIQKAGEYFDIASAQMPSQPEVTFLKGKFAAVKGDTSGAAKSYYQTLQKDTGYIEAYKELSSIYFNKKQYDSSLVFIVAGRMLNPKEPFFSYQEGRILEKVNLLSAAKAQYEGTLVLDSLYSTAYLALANLAMQQGDDMGAIKYLEKDLKFNSNDVSGNLRLAELYQKQERAILAIPLFERLYVIDSTNNFVKTQLDKLYKKYPEWVKPSEQNKDSLDSAVKDSLLKKPNSSIIKQDTSKKAKPLNPVTKPKPKPASEESGSGNFIPNIVNPDSSKIEIKQDTVR